MKVRLVSDITDLATPVADALRAQGFEVEVKLQTTRVHEIHYREGCALEEVTALVKAVKPFLPTVSSTDLTEVDAELHLGDSKELDSWSLKLYSDSEVISTQLRESFDRVGFKNDGSTHGTQEKSKVIFGGATPFARQVVRWFLAQRGIRAVEEKRWDESDEDVWVYIRDPAYDGKNARERFAVELCGDDYPRVFAFKALLEEEGYEHVAIRPVDQEEHTRFTLNPGPFARDLRAARDLRQSVEAFMAEHDVDPERYPLLATDDGPGAKATVTLPLGALQEGRLPPYAGDHPERLEIIIRTDNPDKLTDLRDALLAKGYRRARIEEQPESRLGFRLGWGAAADDPEFAPFVRSLVEAKMEELDATPHFSLAIDTSLGEDNNRVEIDISTEGITDGSLLRRIRAGCADWEMAIKVNRQGDHEALVEELRGMGFKSFTVDVDTDTDPVIKYGGAPPSLVQYIAGLVHSRAGASVPLDKTWGKEDDDIWVYLPASDAEEDSDALADDIDLSAWYAPATPLPARPFIEVGARSVRVAHLTLPRRPHDEPASGLVPRPEEFAHYCLDQRTAETLLHVAESVVLREPCLLEGETSVSKTSIIQYLAMLLGQPIVRLNLNGQTDTGELVGRFMPQQTAQALPLTIDELLAAADLLDPQSRMLLTRARDEGRPLTRVEVQQVMANERMERHPWQWQDGLIIAAMRHGWWIVLDELNLAEPQILERLNSVLERTPSIVLTEFDNSVLSASSGVHPRFRIFATMNPAEYAGRSPLSRAYRDRWRGYRFVSPPTEGDYTSMLSYLISGRQPDVMLRGQPWGGSAQAPPLPGLAALPGIDGFVSALARFHAGLESAVGTASGRRAPQIGARRRERYVFTRRGLLSVMDYLASVLCADPKEATRHMRLALTRYYLGRVSSTADRAAMIRLLDAAGIGPGTWDLTIAAAGRSGPRLRLLPQDPSEDA